MGFLLKYIVILFISTSPVIEGNSTVVPICLSHTPSSNVTVNLSATGLSFSSSSLVFTSINYSIPQDVTVTITNDATDTSGIETRKILLTATSSDLGYSGDSIYIGIKTFDGAYSINAVLAQDTLINKAQKYTGKGLDSLRIQLVRSLWDRYTLPTISASITDASYSGIYKILNSGLTSTCKELTYSNSFFSYKSYIFEPSATPNNKIVYYADGHFITATDGGHVTLLDSCLARGYVVVYIPMLAYFGSTQYLAPISEIHAINPQSYISNPPLSQFLNGYLSIVNYCESYYNPSESIMLGLSGGGWATTVYAALDTRIDKIISMSGTQPIYVNWQTGFGDFEQGFAAVSPTSINDFYNSSGRYLDLYTLCAYQRKYIQIQARYDPCCYGGKYYQTWSDVIQSITNKVGGYYKHYLTQQSCHCVGSKISIVLSEL